MKKPRAREAHSAQQTREAGRHAQKTRRNRRILIHALLILGLSLFVIAFLQHLTLDQVETDLSLATYPNNFQIYHYTYGKFVSFDGSRLHYWDCRARDAKGTVILLHGFHEAKTVYLTHAKFLLDHGYHVFLFDQRGHGLSKDVPCTLGDREVQDLLWLLQHLRRQRGRHHPLFFWGMSLGATYALEAAARDGHVAGVIAERPYHSIRHRLKHVYGFAAPVNDLACLMYWLRTGNGIYGLHAAHAVRQLAGTPVLFVANRGDALLPYQDVEKLFAMKPGGKNFWLAPVSGHVSPFKMGGDTPEYASMILDLLEGRP